MTEEDEAFNEIERRSKAKQEAVRAAMQAERIADCPNCEYHKNRAARWRAEAYKQGGHDVIELPWVGLTDEERNALLYLTITHGAIDFAKACETKLKEKNT